MTFTLLDIILFLGVSQGIFLAISLRLIDNRNTSANRILSLAILVAVIMLFGRAVGFRIQARWVSYVGGLVDATILIFGPLIYCYVRRLAFQETPVYRLSMWHYVPAFAHIAITLGIYTLSPSQMKAIIENKVLIYFWFFVELLGILSFIIYVLFSFKLLKKHKEIMKHRVSYVLAIRRYLTYLLLAICLCTLFWISSFLSTYFYGKVYRFLNYEAVWVSIPLFIYIIGYYSLRQPEIFRMPLRSSMVKEEKARLKPDKIQQLQKRLKYFMLEEQIYKESDVSLKSLAEKLNTSSNNLSWLLNQVYQKSFYDYINEYRVKNVLVSIDRGLHEKQTLLALAYDAGFNSKSTFNKAFKMVTAYTPSAYIKSQKVA